MTIVKKSLDSIVKMWYQPIPEIGTEIDELASVGIQSMYHMTYSNQKYYKCQIPRTSSYEFKGVLSSYLGHKYGTDYF